MARIVLAEQGIAIGVVRELGGTSQQLAVLSMAMLGGAVGGVLISALTVNAEKLARPMMLAVGVIGLAVLVDSMSDGSHHLQRFYLTQAAIAFAGTFFLGPALLLGITSALQHGSRELISFIVLFGIVNALGGLAGPALLGSHNDWSRAVGGTPLGASLDTLRLVAVIAGFTTIYLAILLTLRIRRKLAELRTLRDAALASQPGVADTPIAREPGNRWRPPRPGTTLATAFTALALLGVALVLAAWKLPV